MALFEKKGWFWRKVVVYIDVVFFLFQVPLPKSTLCSSCISPALDTWHRQDAPVRRWWLVPPRLSERQLRAKQRLSAVSQSPQDVIDEAQDGEKWGWGRKLQVSKNHCYWFMWKMDGMKMSGLSPGHFYWSTMIVGKRGWGCRSHDSHDNGRGAAVKGHVSRCPVDLPRSEISEETSKKSSLYKIICIDCLLNIYTYIYIFTCILKYL